MKIAIFTAVIIASLLAICSGIWVAIALVRVLREPSSDRTSSSNSHASSLEIDKP